MKVKICNNCGKHNPIDAWNCENCGETLSVNTITELSDDAISEEAQAQINKQSIYSRTPALSYTTAKTVAQAERSEMTTFNLLGTHLSPAEGEAVVRAYHCTSFNSRLLSLKAEGFLTVTNMRVVFYAYGSSYGGKSVLHSEVPINDVSGINTYKGTYFSITHFLIAAAASFIVANIISAILIFLVGLLIALSSDSLELRATQTTQATQVVLGILGVVSAVVSNSYPDDKIWRPILAATGAFLLAGPGGAGMVFGMLSSLLGMRGNEILSALLLIGAVIVGIYAIITIFRYARRETMSLTIGSRGGSYTPIAISGISVLGLFNTAALKALTAEPASDAEGMIKELGAVITDVQTLGDIGIQKWKV